MAKNENLWVLVDGSSYLFRAYHALPPLTSSKGEHAGAIYGTLNMLRKLMGDYPVENFIVVFDAPGKTFRDDMYADYKANRPPAPEDLISQIAPLYEIIKAMGIPLVCYEGVEADDVIGTLATTASQQGFNVLISTGDKDIAQMVNDKISLIDTMKNKIMDEKGVMDKFSVKPGQMIDYLALVGDTADNVPGVPKVGPKTAAKWLAEYETMDAIINNAEKIKGKVGENLRNNLEQLHLSKRLVTIKCDVEIHESEAQLKKQPADIEVLKMLFSRFEFKTWLQELNAQQQTLVEKKPEPVERNYQTILTKEGLLDWISQLQQATLFSFDTETTSLDVREAELVGLSFATKPGLAVYIPVLHRYDGAPKQLDRDWVLEKIKPLLENIDKPKVAQNLKYDRMVLAKYNIDVAETCYDTMLQSYVIDSVGSKHDMDSLAEKFLGVNTVKFEDVAGKGKKQKTFDQISLDVASDYASEDADITLQLHCTLFEKLSKQASLLSVYNEIEAPLISVLATMESTGVFIDKDMLAEQSSRLGVKIEEMTKTAYELAGEEFNLSSPKQIQHIFYEKQNLPVLKKTPKGQPSTAEAVLQELALDYPLPKLLLEYRSISKLKSTYTDALPDKISSHTGRVHTSYHQAITATGRLSSSHPNLQNIPVRTEEGRKIRQAFVAPPEHKIIAADYSQIELRIMAHLSSDETLLSAFAEGKDVHRATAAEIFSVDDPGDVTPLQRRSAKAINFGLIYGMSAFGLAKQLGIARKDAQDYVNRYFDRYPGVAKFMENAKETAKQKGYVETVYGRRLYLPEILAKNAMRRQYAERTAINAPMQGTAADIIKKAMINIDQWIKSEKVPIKMAMQVHDELVFEVREKDVSWVSEQIRQKMSLAAELKVPLLVDVGVGDNWDEAH
jgi:DNA polymerase I